jgi:hypothetical protein
METKLLYNIITCRMRHILTLLMVLTFQISFCQIEGDTKIIITFNEKAGMYEKVKLALVKNDFIVKDDGNNDTLQTYARELTNLQGYSIVNAIFNDKQIILSGVYGLKKINDWGYTASPKSYKRIIYFKGSKGWKLLIKIAQTIGGEISFSR